MLKMCYAELKSRERKIIEGITLPNQERVIMLGEKKNFKYLGILEMDMIKEKFQVFGNIGNGHD